MNQNRVLIEFRSQYNTPEVYRIVRVGDVETGSLALDPRGVDLMGDTRWTGACWASFRGKGKIKDHMRWGALWERFATPLEGADSFFSTVGDATIPHACQGVVHVHYKKTEIGNRREFQECFRIKKERSLSFLSDIQVLVKSSEEEEPPIILGVLCALLQREQKEKSTPEGCLEA